MGYKSLAQIPARRNRPVSFTLGVTTNPRRAQALPNGETVQPAADNPHK